MSALAAHWAAREEATYGKEIGTAAGWHATLDVLADQVVTEPPDEDGYVASETAASEADKADALALLDEHGLAVDPATVDRLALAVFDERVQFTQRMIRRSEGQPEPAVR